MGPWPKGLPPVPVQRNRFTYFCRLRRSRWVWRAGCETILWMRCWVFVGNASEHPGYEQGKMLTAQRRVSSEALTFIVRKQANAYTEKERIGCRPELTTSRGRAQLKKEASFDLRGG
eukprot:Amastigsp_a676223_6107.p2 type:complete len:117 gc:universal Amastigsp_a676223_6107:453-103(-)